MVTNIINRANVVRKRIKASAKAALSNSNLFNPISASTPSKPYVVSRPAKRTKVEVAVSPNEISGVHGTGGEPPVSALGIGARGEAFAARGVRKMGCGAGRGGGGLGIRVWGLGFGGTADRTDRRG